MSKVREEEKIEKLFEVADYSCFTYVTKKDCNCARCSKDKSLITKGTKVIVVESSKGNARFHIEDFYKVVDSAYYPSTKTINDNRITQNCIEHDLKIIGSKYLVKYFAENGFDSKIHNPQSRLYTLHCNNNYTSGHVVTKAIEYGCRVFVNDTEVTSREQYDRLTKNIVLHDAVKNF